MNKEEFVTMALLNDEVSTDEELIKFFQEELEISEKEAIFYVAQRDKALNNWQEFKLDIKDDFLGIDTV